MPQGKKPVGEKMSKLSVTCPSQPFLTPLSLRNEANSFELGTLPL